MFCLDTGLRGSNVSVLRMSWGSR